MVKSERLRLYQTMHVLLKEIGIVQSKGDLLAGYGVEHTNELTDDDLKHLVDRLVTMKEEKLYGIEKDKKHWRSVVLTLCNKYGVYVTNNDWRAVNALLLQPTIAGKVMYEMSKEELQEAALRLRVILGKRKEVQEIEEELSIQN